jgi:short-subunit dehydrogenase
MNNAQFTQQYGPWVLIVGGSKGIGEAYARQLAAMGLNLVITARGEAEMAALAKDLRVRYGVQVKTVSVDLNDPDVLDTLAPVVDDLDIGLLIYNTAYYDIQEFFDCSIDSHLRTLNVNCRSLLLLVHHVGGALCRRGRGGIIIMSSMSGWQGASLLTTYAASKAFDTVLGEGLWSELRGRGVDVLSFVAGATKTPNFLAMTPEAKQKQAFPMAPDQVAREALASLGRKPIERAGPINKLASFVLIRLLPRRLAVMFMSSANRNLYGS